MNVSVPVWTSEMSADQQGLALRLHPVVPVNQRWANKDTVLPRGGGHEELSPLAVPQGSNTYIAVYSMHRRRDIYGEDADEFKPERWENLHPGWGYVPFGGGPRLCIGREYPLSWQDENLLDWLLPVYGIATF